MESNQRQVKCFFCDIQCSPDDKKIEETDSFFSRFDDFPVTPGHAEIILKKHAESFFKLTEPQLSEMFGLIVKTRLIIEKKFGPDGYNIGVNEGKAGGQTIPHLHIHLIPRYNGDMDNPRGGVRNIIKENGDYSEEANKIGREEYLNR